MIISIIIFCFSCSVFRILVFLFLYNNIFGGTRHGLAFYFYVCVYEICFVKKCFHVKRKHPDKMCSASTVILLFKGAPPVVLSTRRHHVLVTIHFVASAFIIPQRAILVMATWPALLALCSRSRCHA